MSENTRAEELARFYQRKYDDILRRVAAARTTTKPKVYVELGYDGAGTIGNSYNGTMWGKILDNLGAENIAAGRIPGGWGQMNPELVLAADPAFVFIAGSSWDNAPNAVRLGFGSDPAPARATLKTYTARPGWSNMRAVREGHVYGIDHALCRTFFDYTAMEYIAKQLYPAQFADIDPMADLRDYYARYLPVKLTGTWMLSAKP
ncbi:ABC transporter substrate-binding protein [Paraburkholderia sp. MM6662-R1]|uniref:ABC transporter substrate-binding protein n=1 Tax=Paraburkholderia sp. MM6662-R1 TaxID=2991066 RepID=UPI003D1B3360